MGALQQIQPLAVPGRSEKISAAVGVVASGSGSDSDDRSDEDCLVDEAGLCCESDHNVGHLESSVRALLQGLGEDLSRNGLLKTPSRVARALLAATKGYQLSAEETVGSALFAEAGPGNGQGGGCGGMVVVRNNDFFSTCESCLLPFKLRCHIAYIPSAQRVVGLSKLPRVAEIFAARLQNPEKLVDEIAAALCDGFNPLGVAVAAECWHLPWPGNGLHHRCHNIESSWIRRTVCTRRGRFENDLSGDWSEFLWLVGLAQPGKKAATVSCCPFVVACETQQQKFSEIVHFDRMVEAVGSILRSVGEDPNRDELRLTPARYVRWLLASTQGSRSSLSNLINLGALVTSDSEEDEVQGQDSKIKAVLSLGFCSQCEHHLLPFSGVAHVGYVLAPATSAMMKNNRSRITIDRVALEKIVELYSCRLQVQERLTRQIAEAVMAACGGAVSGVMVVLEASHICMISRGIRKAGTSTATLATLGQFACDVKSRVEFLQKIQISQRPSL